ncbi:MAG TPA: hypothetical protein VG711_04855, partial [Phycisphaerales bacterium]|nr:hypothetical protein [Phycisphaerales bacterium]
DPSHHLVLLPFVSSFYEPLPLRSSRTSPSAAGYPHDMPAWVPIPFLSIALLCAVSLAISFILRKARIPGFPIIAGLIAGVLLGPSFLGRIAPDFHERLFIGGASERITLNHVLARENADQYLAETFDARVIDAQSAAASRPSISEARLSLESARRQHQRPLRIMASLLATLLVLTSALMSFERHNPARMFALNIGLWSFTLPAAVALFASLLLFDCDRYQSALVATAVGISPLFLLPFDRRIARNVEPAGPATLQFASRIAALLAVLIALWAFLSSQQGLAPTMIPPLVAFPVSWLLHACLKAVRTSLRMRRKLARAVITSHSLLLPPLAALASIHVEIFHAFSIWPTLLILVLADDGRWAGALVGSILTAGRDPLPTFRLLLPTLSAGSAQLLLTSLAAITHTLPPPIILSLLLGVALIELTTNLRRRVAVRFKQLHDDFPSLDEF